MRGAGQTNYSGAGGTGLTPNIASMICYICAPVPSIIFLLIEKENKDVLFHAWQATLFGSLMIVASLLLNLFGLILGRLVEFLGTFVLNFILPLFLLGCFILWVVCLIKAYQGERWRIPVLGDIAAGKSGV